MAVESFRVACGEAISVSDVDRDELEKPGRAIVPKGIPWAKDIFAVRARGGSMEPMIVDDPWCIFHAHVIGTRRHRYVLVEDQSKIGGDRYTLKRYESRKIYLEDGTWEHEDILLHPLNPGYPVIRLEPSGTYRICGWFVGTVPELQRVKPPRYESIEEE